jgi:hypothetical protein
MPATASGHNLLGYHAAAAAHVISRPSRGQPPLPSCPVQVEYSKQLNESRLKVLQAREDAVQVGSSLSVAATYFAHQLLLG